MHFATGRDGSKIGSRHMHTMNDLCRHEGRDAGARRGGVIRGDYLVQEVVSRVTVPLSGTNIDREA